jgi:alkenylglycerophosphocholine hydrolase
MRKTLTAVFALFALAFLGTIHRTPYPLSFLVKAVPIFALALMVWMATPTGKGRLIGLGLIFSGAGDVVLELPAKGVFVPGLLLFLMAQVIYIFAFFRKPLLDKQRIAVGTGFLAYGIVMGGLLVPNLGPMRIPVMAYLLVITAMGLSAVLGSENSTILVAGAILFILSDSLIAVNRFLVPIPTAGFWIMITYYPAQFLIARGSITTGTIESRVKI